MNAVIFKLLKNQQVLRSITQAATKDNATPTTSQNDLSLMVIGDNAKVHRQSRLRNPKFSRVVDLQQFED